MSVTEDLLRSVLHEHADRVTYQPTRAADVATRARFEARRRTRTIALAEVAVMVVAALPVTWWLARDAPSSPEPVRPPDDARVQLELPSVDALPEGPAPRLAYVDNGVFVSASGDRTELPIGAWADAARYGDGLLVAFRAGTGGELRLVGDSRGAPRCGSLRLAVNVDQSQTAYVEDPGCDGGGPQLLVWGPAEAGVAAGGSEELRVEVDETSPVQPVAVQGTQVVWSTTPDDTPGRVVVEEAASGGFPLEVPGLDFATLASPFGGLVAGCEGDECRVVTYDGDTRFALAADEQALAFSPDGRLLATRVETGPQQHRLVVRDTRSGDATYAVEGSRLAVFGAAWEDDGHLLFHAAEGFRSTLVRLTLDGSTLERATTTAERPAGLTFPGAPD